MCLNSSRTLSKGCRAPPFVGIPSASKLYFLKVAVFHAPLGTNVKGGHRCSDDWAYVDSMSNVKSVSGFSVDVLKFGPLVTLNHNSFLSYAGVEAHDSLVMFPVIIVRF